MTVLNHSQLRAFHEVASEGSFTRAARSLRVSQPTLSAQVKALEETYGVRLFDRLGRRIQPTPLGRSLHKVTTQIFALHAEAERVLAGVRDPVGGALIIGADSPHHAMALLAGVKKANDGVSLSVSVGSAAKVLGDLRDYRCDVAVLSNAPDAPDLRVVPFRRDRLVAIVGANDELVAGSRPIDLSALPQRHLILREKGSVTRDVLESAMASRGLSVRAAMEIQSREAVREAVAAGLGTGVVFESEFGRDAGLAPIAIAGTGLGVTYAVVCLQSRYRLANIRAAMRTAETLADVSLHSPGDA